MNGITVIIVINVNGMLLSMICLNVLYYVQLTRPVVRFDFFFFNDQ